MGASRKFARNPQQIRSKSPENRQSVAVGRRHQAERRRVVAEIVVVVRANIARRCICTLRGGLNVTDTVHRAGPKVVFGSQGSGQAHWL